MGALALTPSLPPEDYGLAGAVDLRTVFPFFLNPSLYTRPARFVLMLLFFFSFSFLPGSQTQMKNDYKAKAVTHKIEDFTESQNS